MIFLYAFLIGGLLCSVAQIIQDRFRLTPGHITAIFVVMGALLEFFDIYDHLISFASAGALVPITSFGHTLAHGGFEMGKEKGILGVFEGIFSQVSVGIAMTIFFSIIAAFIFKPKD